jgi:hypothetical protein
VLLKKSVTNGTEFQASLLAVRVIKPFSALALIAALEGVNGSQAQRRGALDDDLAIGVRIGDPERIKL